jgi:hypothetical protein
MAEANIESNSQKWQKPKLANAPKMAKSEMTTTAKNGRSQYWQQQPKMAPAKIG